MMIHGQHMEVWLMNVFVYIMIGVFAGGIVGVVAMCLVQITQCSRCPYRRSSFNRDGK